MSEKISKIREWLNKGGFPFEMNVAKIFNESGFQIGQSVLFRDSETAKYRETDIIAFITKGIDDVWFNITFVIECKKITNKPWIILKKSPSYKIHKEKILTFGSNNAMELIQKISKNTSFQSPLIFPNILECGYNVVTAFSDKNDSSYAASQSVLKAIEYLVNQSNMSRKKFCNIYIPIIAIDGELYESFLDSNNEIEIEEKRISHFLSNKSFEENGLSVLNVVTSNEIANYVKELKNQCDNFFIKYEKELKDIAKSYPSNVIENPYDHNF
ncbi:hypothetical protein [Chryseobacterium sp. 18068]|uniref:hypothetical protein n=1 Tax=Chryseobacterium sp. 18068 TaxID=2681414 RepID=UPI00135B8C58|nr:hypothetical protein [Chryseobacterium sp. 18068]